MKNLQNLRRIAVMLGVSGTAVPIMETRLYKGGYAFVYLHAYVPYTQNRSSGTSPLCTVHRTTVDKFGNRKQFNKEKYNMIYVNDSIIDGASYMLFECRLPKTFTDTVGTLEMVFTYSEVYQDGEDDNGKPVYRVSARLASGVYSTTVYDGEISDDDTIDSTGGALAQYNDIIPRMEILEDSVDALLSPPDNTEADKVGTPRVELTHDGRLKFIELKGKQGEENDLAVFAFEAEKSKGFLRGGEIDKAFKAFDEKFKKEVKALKQRFSEEIEQLLALSIEGGGISEEAILELIDERISASIVAVLNTEV